jgi:hypothetical protein
MELRLHDAPASEVRKGELQDEYCNFPDHLRFTFGTAKTIS